MSRTRGVSPGAYARSVERELSRLRAKPVLLSPRDWALVSEWHARGIPLAAVLEVMEEAASRSRWKKTPETRSLAYFAPAVEEAWEVLRAGRLAPASVAMPARTDGVAVWEEASRALPGTSPLALLLQRLLDGVRSGGDAVAADRELDACLLEAAPREIVERVEADTSRALAPFLARMDPEVLDRTRSIGVVDRLRRALGLPRISPAPPEDASR
jgi:hypothetical protein